MELIDIKSPYKYYYLLSRTPRERAWVIPQTTGTCRNIEAYREVEPRGDARLKVQDETLGELQGYS